MPIRSKMILMNAATFFGLLYASLRGAPLSVIILSGVLLFGCINLILFLKVKRGGAAVGSGKGQEL